jgi:ferredoxin-like protein FixX
MPDWWEDQFETYYFQVTKRHWNPTSNPPSEGFKTMFKRACIAGVMARNGFNPLTPAEIEDKLKQERKAREEKNEEIKREEERERRAKEERQKIRAHIENNFAKLPESKQNEIRMEYDFCIERNKVKIKDEINFIYWSYKRGLSHIGDVEVAELVE